ncbi:MAG: tRNA uridine-5-carboxymethylaminomethyl(34) synthesis GTPase MnmE [Proteobacteria bacterium CG1_02_64_396]|nr:MAG: tRNA uridine-5-carboxymethylaminomethyl(34) synthesis GTPase MnmE [Proteobacteria bacterium CG1_02_64_396]
MSSSAFTDTIAAVATPPGLGGVAIVRVSGPEVARVFPLLPKLPDPPPPRTACFTPLVDDAGEVLDEILALYFPAPRSYTGEDVLELHLHGNPHLCAEVLSLLATLDIRPAQPGEFTRRAFLNGRLDLTQAEAVEKIIHAPTREGRRAAVRLLDGGLGEAIGPVREALIDLLAQVEAHIDFEVEESGESVAPQLEEGLKTLLHALDPWVASRRTAERLFGGVRVVLAGRPNVGKSSLFNRLLGEERAIVTAIAGTTRDLIDRDVHLGPYPVRLIDTAGLRQTEDVIEAEGVGRSRRSAAQADLLLWVSDDPDEAPPEDLTRPCDVRIDNKRDAWGGTSGWQGEHRFVCAAKSDPDEVFEALRAGLGHLLGDVGGEESLTATARQGQALAEARQHLLAAQTLLRDDPDDLELIAEELHGAAHRLAELLGEIHGEDVLDRVFSSFCIGK